MRNTSRSQMNISFLQKSKIAASQIRASQISYLQMRPMLFLPVNPENTLCQICIEEQVFLKDPSPFKCKHHITCQTCLIRLADHCFQQNNQLKCPKPNCPGLLNQEKKILEIFPKELQDLINYNYHKGERKFKNNVRCSTTNCYGFINNGTCSLCLTNFCQNCYQKQHYGKCTTDNLALTNIKNCPNCGQGIFKDGGCLEVKCRCNHVFCFKCLQDWNKSHHITCGISFWESLFN